MRKRHFLLPCLLTFIFLSACSKRYAYLKTIPVDAVKQGSMVKSHDPIIKTFFHRIDSLNNTPTLLQQEKITTLATTTIQEKKPWFKQKKPTPTDRKKTTAPKRSLEKESNKMNNLDTAVSFLIFTLIACLVLLAFMMTAFGPYILIALLALTATTWFFALQVFFEREKGKAWAVFVMLLALFFAFISFGFYIMSWMRSSAGGIP